MRRLQGLSGYEELVPLLRGCIGMPVPNVPHFNDPDHWHQRAEEMRTLAEGMSDEIAQKMMRGIAADYDKLAVRAAHRIDGTKSG